MADVCPHSRNGDPRKCSQCAILAQPVRRVALRDGMLHVDGEPTRALSEINREKFVEENESGRPRRLIRCGRCLQPGHNARSCPNPPAPSIRPLTDREALRTGPRHGNNR